MANRGKALIQGVREPTQPVDVNDMWAFSRTALQGLQVVEASDWDKDADLRIDRPEMATEIFTSRRFEEGFAPLGLLLGSVDSPDRDSGKVEGVRKISMGARVTGLESMTASFDNLASWRSGRKSRFVHRSWWAACREKT